MSSSISDGYALRRCLERDLILRRRVAQHLRAVRDALEQSGAESVAQAQGAADQARSASVPVALAQTPNRSAPLYGLPTRPRTPMPQRRFARYTMRCRKTWSPHRGYRGEGQGDPGRDAARAFPDRGRGRPTVRSGIGVRRLDAARQRQCITRFDPLGSLHAAAERSASLGRLGQLLAVVDDAIDHAVENRAALDQIAVRRNRPSKREWTEPAPPWQPAPPSDPIRL
jgi:hypothetical protein